MTHTDIEPLEAMEVRVYAAYLNVVRDHTPIWPVPDAWSEWLSEPSQAIVNQPAADGAAPRLQFPREQWVVLPNRRRFVLEIVEGLLNRIAETGECTDMMLAYLATMLTFGGRLRVV
ncbi:hypothetical protein E3G52_000323 [Mycobacteroides abscessus]|uniref:hypothetical protein n=1 Tax=Mycobacteroides abscessus TaxID=36809 RepID=UPI001877EF19|nr:hypothetical protein [Mycobacteroides abscessus]MBE5453459.1 hypothetical protein [Mycobacteroides abscessus]